MYTVIRNYISELDTSLISDGRKSKLDILVEYIIDNLSSQNSCSLNFICTHNSRRSHLCQVWAKTMSQYCGLSNIKCYSGGTEETAVYPIVIETLENTGFRVSKIAEDTNPTYKLNYNEDCPMTLFSKKYDDHLNPSSGFAAVMTCTDADMNCPIIPEATRISLPYEDPKVSDGTAQQKQVYTERSKQIATEMKYVMEKVATSIHGK